MRNEIVKVGILSEFWEHQNKDVIDIVLPIIKSVISSNYNINGKYKIINLNSALKELKTKYNENFTMLFLKSALNRLENYQVVAKHDDSYCVNDEQELKNTKNSEEKMRSKVSEEWNAIINDLKSYVNKETFIPFFKNINIENNFWDFLNKDIDLINNIDISDNANKVFASYIIHKKEIDDNTYKYIKRIVLAIFISKTISLYEICEVSYWKNKKFVVDTRFLMNLLTMNYIEDNDASTELFNLLKNNNCSISTYTHNLDEINKVIDAYQYQRKNGSYCNTNIDFFQRENYNNSQISLFCKRLENQVKNLGISIIDTSGKEYIDNKYNKEFDKNYANRENSITIEYDRRNYCNTMEMHEKDDNIIFLSTGKGLPGLYKRIYKKTNKFVFISEDDLACLCFANSSHSLSNFRYLAKLFLANVSR